MLCVSDRVVAMGNLSGATGSNQQASFDGQPHPHYPASASSSHLHDVQVNVDTTGALCFHCDRSPLIMY